MPRPPRTLWAFLFFELIRLVGLSAIVLVLIIAFGAAIKPLSDGLLHAGDLLLFIALAVPPMLAYALPFAAGFGSTLVYHRLAADHEATAAYAGGISHKALLAPAAIVGLFLACVLGVLNEAVIPRFYRVMEGLVSMNLPRFIVQQTERGRGVVQSNMAIFADRAERADPPAGSGASDFITLYNFALLVLDNGKPVREITASVARLWVYPPGAMQLGNDEPSGEFGTALLDLENAIGAGDQALAGSETYQLYFQVKTGQRDKVKYFSWGELRGVKRIPETMNTIETLRRNVANDLSDAAALARIDESLRERRRAQLIDSVGNPVTIFAGGVELGTGKHRVLPAPGASSVEFLSTRVSASGVKAPLHTSAKSVWLVPAQPAAQTAVGGRVRTAALVENWTLEAANARTVEVPASHQGSHDFSQAPERTAYALSGLSSGSADGAELRGASADTLVALADARPPPVPAAEKLRKEITRVRNDALSTQHQRMALCVSCFVMTITGAIAALYFSSRLPLTVYLFTFFPALACMVTISGGQQMVVQHGPAGLLPLWAGVLGLSAYSLVVFRKLAKH